MEEQPTSSPVDIQEYLPNVPENSNFETGSIYEIGYQAVLRMVATERYRARKKALNASDDSYDAAAWSTAWNAEPKNRTIVEKRHAKNLTVLREQIGVANDIVAHQQRIANKEHEDTRAAVQHALGSHIWRHIIYPGASKLVPKDRSVENRIRGSALSVVSPTGSGKTYIQADTLRNMGIGQPAVTDPERNRRALVCVSDQAMVNQYTGRVGDNTFRRVLGEDVSIGAVWQHEKDADQDVTVVVTSTLPDLIKQGLIDPKKYDVTVVDEAHRALGDRVAQTLRKLGSRLLLFTATPTYDDRRALRKVSEVVSEGTIAEFVEKGILSPVRLMTYRPEPGQELEAAAYLAGKAIKDGRKVLVYCKPSSPELDEKTTQYIARRINEQVELSDDVTPAVTVGKVNSVTKNKQHVQDFQEGRIRAVTTVGMLREGYNDPEVDTVIILGPALSLVDLEQKLGRCMRRGDRAAMAIELIPSRGLDDWRRYYSLWNVFGFEEMRQAALIGGASEDGEGLEGVDLNLSPGTVKGETHAPGPQSVTIPRSMPMSAVPDAGSRDSVRRLTPRTAADDEILTQYKLPADLGTYYDDMLVRRMTLSPEANEQEEIKTQSISISSLAAQYDLSEAWLKGRLDKAGVPYTSIYEFNPETGERSYERWYDRKAFDAYQAATPLPKGGQRFGFDNTARLLGVTRKSLRHALAILGIEGEPGVEANKRETITFDMHTIRQIEAEIQRIPPATDDDVALIDLANEFKERGWLYTFPLSYAQNAKNGIPLYERRRLRASAIGFPQDHISAKDAARIREIYENGLVATEEHISIPEIARLAGVTVTSVSKYLTEEDRIGAQWLRSAPDRRAGEHLERQRGLAVVDRLEPKRLPPELVPMPMAMERLAAAKRTVQAYIHRHHQRMNPQIHNLLLSKVLVSCISWPDLEELENKYGIKDTVNPIDFKRIIKGDTEYMRTVQMWHIDKAYLGIAEWVSAEEAQAKLGCTAAALPVLLNMVKEKDQVDSFLQRIAGQWHVRGAVLDRMARYTVKGAKPDFVSHERLLAELKRHGLEMPQRRYAAGDREIARNQKGVIDVYFKARAAAATLEYARSLRDRRNKLEE